MSTPQTIINIVSGVAIDSRYRHSIYFGTQEQQLEFFGGKVVKRFSAYSYCRKNWVLKVDATLEEARKWNYLYFQNTASGKWWFYFINDVEYKNDNTVELSLELDVIQTYQFDWRFNTCFIERQHAPSDQIGENQVEENLDTGELTCSGGTDLTELEDLCILMLATFDPLTTTSASDIDVVYASRYNKVFNAAGVFAVDGASWQALGVKLNLLSGDGTIDGIISMWMYPKVLVNLGKYSNGEQATWDDGKVCKPVASMTANTMRFQANFSPWSGIDGYVPKNNKVLQYPYNFLYVSNNQGGGAVYRYERFTSDPINPNNNDILSVAVHLYGGYSPESAVKCVLPDYDYMGHETALTLNGFPTCAWNADAYKIWLAQNQNSQNLSTAMSGLSIVGGVVTAGVSAYTGNLAGVAGGVGAMIHGGKGIADILATKQDRAIQPPQARGSYSAITNIVSGKQTFTFYPRHITKEQAKIIDDYFTMYGYAMNRVDTPRIRARSRFTYIKTNGMTINGQIGNADRLKIESIFDNGITFWTDGSDIGNYYDDNVPMWDTE